VRLSGFETKSLTPCDTTPCVDPATPGGVKSGARDDENPTLERLAEALGRLSETERQRLLAMLERKPQTP